MAAHAESFPTAPKAEKRESLLSPTLSRKMLLLFILGGGIYARTGEVAGEVGGAIWTGFALAGVIAALTAAWNAELVSKFAQAAGAALYVHCGRVACSSSA
jgi:amino acid transporter